MYYLLDIERDSSSSDPPAETPSPKSKDIDIDIYNGGRLLGLKILLAFEILVGLDVLRSVRRRRRS